MRIFLLLAAAAGMAAVAAAAPARPAGSPGSPGVGGPGAWDPGGGHGARSGWRGRSRPAAGRGRDRRDRRHGGRHGPYFLDGFAIVWPGAQVAPYGNGFFADGGGGVRIRGGRPHYDYDRSYPYEWASPAAGRPDRDEERQAAPPPRCTFENSVRVCRGP
jgi:hypothetical protein